MESLITPEQKFNLLKIIDKFHKNHNNYQVIYLTLTGSKLFGLNTESSDTDIKGIFIPSKEDLLLQQVKDTYSFSTGSNNTKNTNKDIDLCLFSIHHFLKNLEKGETNSIDIFFSMYRTDTIILETSLSKIIKTNKDNILTTNINPMINFSKSLFYRYQKMGEKLNEIDLISNILKSKNLEYLTDYLEDIKKNKYNYIEFTDEFMIVLGKKYEYHIKKKELLKILKSIKERYGNRANQSKNQLDYKAISHAIRLSYQALEFTNDNHITFPLKGEYRNMVMKTKMGLLELSEIQNIICNNLENIQNIDIIDKKEKVNKLILKFF